MTPAGAAILLLLGPMALGCSGTTTASSFPDHVEPRASEPRWEDAFDGTSELVLVIRPQAVRHDGTYGPVLRHAIDLARQQGRLGVAAGTLDVMLDADEVIVAARDSGRRGGAQLRDATDDLVVAVRGVRAEIDPVTLVDERGKALWAPGPNAPAAGVRELLRVHDDGEVDASLFELPGRDWVIATGPARTRARERFSQHSKTIAGPGRADFRVLEELDRHALAVARLSGPTLVSHVGPLRPPGLLAPIGHDLSALTVVLSPGDDAVVRATLRYSSHEAIEPAKATVEGTIRALLAAKPAEYAWLRSASVTRSDCCILMTAPLPGHAELGNVPEPTSPPPARDAGATH